MVPVKYFLISKKGVIFKIYSLPKPHKFDKCLDLLFLSLDHLVTIYQVTLVDSLSLFLNCKHSLILSFVSVPSPQKLNKVADRGNNMTLHDKEENKIGLKTHSIL